MKSPTLRHIRAKDAAWQKLEVLKTNRNKRYHYGEFLVEGVRNLNEARRFGWTFSSLIYPAERSPRGIRSCTRFPHPI